MDWTGGCYCGDVRYRSSGEVVLKAMCLCRECQHITGGGANVTMVVEEGGFTYTQGSPKGFARADLEPAALREFCPNCGTHLVTRSPRVPGKVIVKVGTLDNPADYGMPTMAAYTREKQVYHCVPPEVTCFDTVPQRPG